MPANGRRDLIRRLKVQQNTMESMSRNKNISAEQNIVLRGQ